MVERVFLGWDRPFVELALAWMLELRDELPGAIALVPTAQSGRRMRESLAIMAGAVFSPKWITPGSLLHVENDRVADEWAERLAWVEILQSVEKWEEFEGLFPIPPTTGLEWAGPLAREMVSLRRTLQESGLLLAGAARKLTDTPEGARWQALASLEDQAERKLQSWGLISRSRALAGGIRMPDTHHLILVGVTEMPPLLERAIIAWSGKVTVLIGAPASESEHFSEVGKPGANWASRPLASPNGGIQVVADPRQQAVEALRVIREAGTQSSEVTLGSADPAVGDELARVFSQAGWAAFHPASRSPPAGLVRWFKSWQQWLRDPSLAVFADLLTLPETGPMIGGKRAQKARILAEWRDRWLMARPEDLIRRFEVEVVRRGENAEVTGLIESLNLLGGWRSRILGPDFTREMGKLLATIATTGPTTADEVDLASDWLERAIPLIRSVDHGAAFWIEMMAAAFPVRPPTPPDDRVLDVQGWLELFHEPGRHLVLCGMNEGMVPARAGGEPWLSEPLRVRLNLITESDRAARDSFLYHAMIEARRTTGRVDVICGKSGPGGETYLPSRLLLAVARDELPRRVKSLFREVEPPDAGLRWQADWHWQPRFVPAPQRLNATSLKDYLECPTRYYLKHVLRMQEPEPGRGEWNARDFGVVAHSVLERWGRDPEAREFVDPEMLHGWLSAELDRMVAESFGRRIPLAVRIQVESIRQRLVWFSRIQAASRVEGWETIEVEHKVEIDADDAKIIAMIDRIDRHRETGRLRVLDYKTGKIGKVEDEHRKVVRPGTRIPAHLGLETPAFHEGEVKGKSVSLLWRNLQLPLYAYAWVQRGEPLPTPCYFSLGPSESQVGIQEWEGFSEADMSAAETCAWWIAGQIRNRVFEPAASEVRYDGFEILAAGRSFPEMILPPPGVPLQPIEH